MRTLAPLFLAATLLAGPGAQAGHYADLYVIPVASHTAGAHGTNWMSDVAIHNFQTTPLSAELVLIATGESTEDNVLPLTGATPIVVPPGGTRIVADFMNGSGAALGAVVIGADKPFALTSRSYSMSPSGDTVGQTVTASRDFLTDALLDSASNAAAYLPGLILDNRFRTNIGFAAGAGLSGPLLFQITIRNAEGAVLGSEKFLVPAGTYMHRQMPVTRFTSTGFSAGSAEVKIVGGDGAIVPYASVIDNGTADAVFVSGHFPPQTPFTQSALPSVFEQLLVRYGRADR